MRPEAPVAQLAPVDMRPSPLYKHSMRAKTDPVNILLVFLALLVLGASFILVRRVFQKVEPPTGKPPVVIYK